jgi:hypothetical protein
MRKHVEMTMKGVPSMKALPVLAVIFSLALAGPAIACDDDKNQDDKEKAPQSSSYETNNQVTVLG